MDNLTLALNGLAIADVEASSEVDIVTHHSLSHVDPTHLTTAEQDQIVNEIVMVLANTTYGNRVSLVAMMPNKVKTFVDDHRFNVAIATGCCGGGGAIRDRVGYK